MSPVIFDQLTRWKPTRPTYGVVGYPVAHSLSPAMHEAAFRALKIDAQYLAFEIPPDRLNEGLELLEKAGVVGLNLTLPHKQKVLPWLSEISPEASQISAANTLLLDAGKRLGFNTDGKGFSKAIEEAFARPLHALHVMVIGTGGAGRAVAFQSVFEGCRKLLLVNRTLEKAQSLAKELRSVFYGDAPVESPLEIEALTLDSENFSHQIDNIDLIVNATSLGLKSEDSLPLPIHFIKPNHLVFDVIYHHTPFLQAAQKAGAKTAHGLGMLLHQGALAFEIWFAQPAPIEVMRQALLSANP